MDSKKDDNKEALRLLYRAVEIDGIMALPMPWRAIAVYVSRPKVGYLFLIL